MFCVVRSLNVPVAANRCVVPAGPLGLGGVTAIDTSTALVTVIRVVPEMPSSAAVIVAVPTASAVASPRELAAFEICAMAVADEVHVTWVVRSAVVPLLNVPVA